MEKKKYLSLLGMLRHAQKVPKNKKIGKVFGKILLIVLFLYTELRQ